MLEEAWQLLFPVSPEALHGEDTMARSILLAPLFAALLLSTAQAGWFGRPGRAAKPAEAELALPKEIRNAADDSTLLLVPSGEFRMGPPGDPRRVSLRAFYIDRTEVTNRQYAKFLAAVAKHGDAAWRHPDQPATKTSHVPAFWSHPELGEAKPDNPVVGVSWFDAYAYAKWADKRLPTEAEWERAARGTDARIYPWGNSPPAQGLRYLANYFSVSLAADGFRFTAPVGAFPAGASPCGCLDMAGNAAEWCADWFGPLPQGRLVNPTGAEKGAERVTKGGAWNLNADSIRTFSRWALEPDRQLSNVGFRCAKDAVAAAPAPPAK